MGGLTAAKARALAAPGRYGDGGTLYLVVAPGGSKSWVQRLTIDGKRHDIGLGGWPVVSLAMARDRAFANRRAVAEGRDPLAEKRKTAAPTFREASARARETNEGRWRHAKTAMNWDASLAMYAYPIIGDKRVDRIGREDVLGVLTPIWVKKPEVARKVRQRIRATLAWAQAHGYVEQNLAGEAINGALPALPAVREHFRALPYGEVGAALDTIHAARASVSARACLRFVVLTACRSGEARLATWGEMELQKREWRIPGERMKTGDEHRVPLSDAALEVLEQVRPLRDSSGLVFPSPSRPGRPLSDMALTKLLRDVGLADRATVHGFRSSFRTWASERTSVPHAVCEMALAHRVGSDVERSYARSKLFEKRRGFMAAWAEHVTGGAARVVRLLV